MGRGKAPIEACRICGSIEKLSWEHVPPQSAFNTERYKVSNLEDSFELDGGSGKFKIVQGGIGAHTLCERCNNNTGSWYGNAFADWCYQGANLLIQTGGKPRLIYLHYIYPLRVLKQIITMAFSMNGHKFREVHPELVAFVLNRERRWLNPEYRIFVYFNVEGSLRRIGDSVAMINLFDRSQPVIVTEINHPPYGYVLTTDGTMPNKKLKEITHFQRYAYDELEVAPLYLEVLETHLPIPLDYRTRTEIEADIAKNRAHAAVRDGSSIAG